MVCDQAYDLRRTIVDVVKNLEKDKNILDTRVAAMQSDQDKALEDCIAF